MRNWRNDKVLSDAEKNLKSQTNEIKLELKIRKKAIENNSFPSEAVIEEFLKVPKYPEVSVNWIQPDINAFIVGKIKIISYHCILNYYTIYIKYFIAICID